MDNTKKRLRYQSWHRGCKETDDILGPFADAWLPDAPNVAAFEALLAEDDWDIFHWLTGENPAPAQHSAMIKLIQQFQAQRVVGSR